MSGQLLPALFEEKILEKNDTFKRFTTIINSKIMYSYKLPSIGKADKTFRDWPGLAACLLYGYRKANPFYKTKCLFQLCCLCFLLISISTVNAQKKKADIIIHSVDIVDVPAGKIIPDQTVVISNDRILKTGKKQLLNQYTAATVIHAKGKYIMPGLWDMHIHFGGGDTLAEENKDLLALYLANGVVAVRDCSADLSRAVLQWRREIGEKILEGPVIFTAGPKLEGYKSIWIGDLEVDNSAELETAIDSLVRLKVDFVKITDNTMRPALYLEALQKVRAKGLKITGHVPASLTITEVSDSGLNAIEHITYLLRAGSSREKEYTKAIGAGKMTPKEYNTILLNKFDTLAAWQVFKQMAKNGTAVVPTISINRTIAYLDQDNHKNDPYLNYIGKGLRGTYTWRVERAAKDNEEAIAFRHSLIEAAAGLLPLLQKAGVTIIAGTDAGYLNSFVYPGFALHDELELMVKYGLTPQQALAASVINGPVFFEKQKDYCAVSAGKLADLLLLNENPLQNITATRSIFSLVRNGKLYTREQLDQLLLKAKQKTESDQRKL